MNLVLGFDLGAHGAVAIAEYPEGEVFTRPLHLPSEGEEGEKAWAWHKAVLAVFAHFMPVAVAYEEAHFVGSLGQSQKWIKRQEGILLSATWQVGLMCVPVPTPTVRAHARNVGGLEKWPAGSAKIHLQAGAADHGWIPSEWVGVKKYEDEADACWVADWLRHQKLEGV
jgi:hypothetical protein